MLSSIVLRLLPRNCAALSAPCLQCRLRPVLAGASFKSCRPCAECSMPSPLQVRLLPWTARTRSTPRASTAFAAPSKDPSRLYGKMFSLQVPRRDVSSCPYELNACPIPLPAACCSVRTFSAQQSTATGCTPMDVPLLAPGQTWADALEEEIAFLVSCTSPQLRCVVFFEASDARLQIHTAQKKF